MSFQSPLPRLDDPALRRANGRRMRVVVAGEFKSGKSSVINALLRNPVLPMQSRQASRPAFLVRHSPEGGTAVLLHDGSGRTTPALALDDATDFSGAGLCEVVLSAPHLEGVELVELPFPCDGEVGAEALALMAGADLLIWVSIASQAWRLSEKQILAQLPPMRGRSVIVLSRADKLRSATDWDRIEERVQREAGPFFCAVAFVQASRETIRASTTDDRAWETSGGRILAELIAERRRRVIPELGGLPEPAPAAAQPVSADRTVSVRPVSTPSPMRVEPEAPMPPATPVTAPKPLVAPQAAIAEVAASLSGLRVGGIVSLATGDVLAAFGPTPDEAVRLAPGVRMTLAARSALEAATGASLDETTLRFGSAVVLAAPVDGAEAVAFLLFRQETTNILLARTALRRICGLWVGGE